MEEANAKQKAVRWAHVLHVVRPREPALLVHLQPPKDEQSVEDLLAYANFEPPPHQGVVVRPPSALQSLPLAHNHHCGLVHAVSPMMAAHQALSHVAAGNRYVRSELPTPTRVQRTSRSFARLNMRIPLAST